VINAHLWGSIGRRGDRRASNVLTLAIVLLIYLPFYRGSRIFSIVSHGWWYLLISGMLSNLIEYYYLFRSDYYEWMITYAQKENNPENFMISMIPFLRNFDFNILLSYAKLRSAVSSFLREYLGGRFDSLIFLAGHAELRTLAGERERDTTRWQSCQRRPINLSSGCWHGDCRTELGWMARRAMRGHSRILHETVTEKLEAAAAPMAQEKGGTRERRGNVFEGKLYVGARK